MNSNRLRPRDPWIGAWVLLAIAAAIVGAGEQFPIWLVITLCLFVCGLGFALWWNRHKR